MDLAKHAVPARAAGQVSDRFLDTVDGAGNAAVAVVPGGGVHRPVNQHGTPDDGVAVHEAPVAAVPAAVAIISHHKVVFGWDDQFVALDVIHNLPGPLGAQPVLHETAVGRRIICDHGILGRRVMNHVRLRDAGTVYVHSVAHDADVVSGQTDDALHVVRMIVEGKFEDDDVAVADRPVGQQMLVPGAAAFEDKFVHEKVIADQKRRLHRFGRNLERLDDERGAEQGEQNGDEQGIDEVDNSAYRGFCSRPGGDCDGLL